MWRASSLVLRFRSSVRRVCSAAGVAPPSNGTRNSKLSSPSVPPPPPPPPQEPVMPEEYECCGNECGTDCVWSSYFEDQAKYLKELKAWEQKTGLK